MDKAKEALMAALGDGSIVYIGLSYLCELMHYPLNHDYISQLQSNLSEQLNIVRFQKLQSVRLEARGNPKDWNDDDWHVYNQTVEVEESINLCGE